MEEVNLEDALDEVWKEKTRKRLIPLKKPFFDFSSNTAAIDIYSKEIRVNPKFIEELNKNKISPEISLDGVIEHELGHYFVMPRDLTTQLLEINTLKEMTDVKKRDKIINYFNDVVVNLNILLQRGSSSNSLGLVYKNITKEDNKLGKLLCAYYHSFAKEIDFGSDFKELDKSLKSKFIALNYIDFTSVNKLNVSYYLLSFKKIVEDLIKMEKVDSSFEEGNTPIRNASEEEKNKALKELAGILDIDDYKYIRSVLNYGDYSHDDSNRDSKKADAALIDYYEKKAMQYPVKILRMPLITENEYKERLSEWVPSDSLQRMNLLRTGGRIIPGVTKKWIKGTYNTYGQKIKIPDCIIVIDSSGSMERVSSGKSYAAIAAVSAAIQYMDNGAKVDVVNFSSDATVTRYKDRRTVLEALLEDKNEGTNFPSSQIKDMLSEKNKDLVVITDGKVDYEHITNFFNILNEKGKQNRISFIYFTASDSDEYDEFIKNYKNIRFHFVKEAEDIPKLVIGDTDYGSK